MHPQMIPFWEAIFTAGDAKFAEEPQSQLLDFHLALVISIREGWMTICRNIGFVSKPGILHGGGQGFKHHIEIK